MKLNIPIILGTARENNNTRLAAAFVQKSAQEYGFESNLLDVVDYVKIPKTIRAKDLNESSQWGEIMQKADGLIIVAPEYNHGYPGELKLMLDQLKEEYWDKPLGIVGTGASLGGGRMIEQLRTVAIELRLVPISKSVYFFNVWEVFDQSGAPKNSEVYQKQCHDFFVQLEQYAVALKQIRQKK